jgi:hypothetical protein
MNGTPIAAKTAHTALTLLCLVVATSACHHQRVEESATKTLHFDAGERTLVEIRVDDGSVELSGGAQDQIEVVFTSRARARDSRGARSLLRDAHVEAVQQGDTLHVSARAASSGIGRRHGGVTTDVTVRVPSDTSVLDLDIRTEDGSIELNAISGTIVAETADGRIRLSRVEGSVRLRTGDGSITGQELRGQLDVVSDDGRIRLDGDFTQLRVVTADGSIHVDGRETTTIANDWSLRTSDGSITLLLANGADAELDATSGDGEVVNHLSRFQGASRRNRIRGQIGAGGPFILVTTMDGKIVLRDS